VDQWRGKPASTRNPLIELLGAPPAHRIGTSILIENVHIASFGVTEVLDPFFVDDLRPANAKKDPLAQMFFQVID